MKTIKRENKEAVFLTLSAFFLAMAVLAFAILIYHYSSEEKIERASELFALNRLSELSSSVEKSLSDVFDIYSDSIASITENPDGTTNVSIKEAISRDEEDWGEDLKEEAENFKNFVEKYDRNIRINVSSIEDNRLSFSIMPHNITYSRSWEVGHVTLSTAPQQINFGSYSILVNSSSTEIDKTLPQFGESGSFYFGVRATDSYGHNLVEEKFVDPYDRHEIQVFFKNGNKVKIDFVNKNLDIWTNSPDIITITTTIDSLEKTSEKVRVGYLSGAINATFSDFGILKIGSIEA